jgi:hypothetical protein
MNISVIDRSNRIGQSTYGGLYDGYRVDWTKTPTKQAGLPSMDEIRKKVKENAKAFANAVSEKEKDRLAAESQILFVQYESHVAPDRKKLLADALETIEEINGKGTGSGKSKSDIFEPKTIFDFLIETDKKEKGMEYDKPYSFDGGTITAAHTTSGLPHYTVKAGGQDAITIDPRSGVGFFSTPAERIARREIVDVWFNARDKEVADNEKKKYNAGSEIDLIV